MNEPPLGDTRSSHVFSLVLVSLMRGVTYRDDDAQLWDGLLGLQARVREHLQPLGLDLVLDESEGHAYLCQHQPAAGEPELPRLVARRQLGYQVSLLLVLLRQKLAEGDPAGAEARVVLTRHDIVELLRVFCADTANEARLVDRIDASINKVVELGFLRRLRGRAAEFEVRRIIKTFVDAQWLHELEQRLAAYRAHLATAGERAEDVES